MNKSLIIVALALVASATACEYKEQRTVQQPAPAATVVATPAPAGSVVYTQPAPATTTVYTR
jgi:hypothetical protein